MESTRPGLTAKKPPADLLIRDAAELLTMAGSAGDPIGRVPGGSVAIAGERILAAGPSGDVEAAVDTTGARVIDAAGKVVMPGFVDCHTHLIFGGSRVEEYAARVAGEDVSALARRGVPVGISGTVAQTRALSVEQLVEAALPRLAEMLTAGTTTVESKSGYGLDVESELRMLRANRELAGRQPVDVVSTFLGAHAIPTGADPDAYVDLVVAEMIPRVAEEGLAEFCDVYCDEGYFTAAQSERVLAAGLAHGLRAKIHLDQYSYTGAASLAADLGCVSADHLNFTPAAEVERLAASGVVAVPLPGLDFAVAHPRPVDLRFLRQHGAELALATDFCPGCWLTNMQLVVVLACRLHCLPVGEALRAATLGAANAIGRGAEIGSLEPGKLADALVLDVARHEEIAYRIGYNAVETVVKCGRIVVER
jgi:imidazolonepropionase